MQKFLAVGNRSLILYGFLNHVCHAGIKVYHKVTFGGLFIQMENFLKPFLENETKNSLVKAPINVDYSTESSIIKALQKIIFKHDVRVEFKNLLNLTCSPEPFTVNNDVIKKIIKSLNAVLLSDEDVKTKSDIFRYVFQSFISSCKVSSQGDETLYIVQFFLILSHILGISSIFNNKDDNKDSNNYDYLINEENFKNGFEVDPVPCSSDSFLLLKELLLCLSKNSINLNGIETTYSKWLQHLIKKIANFQPFHNIFMEIFYISAEIDLKLFEPNLDCIFSNIFAQGVSLDENFPKKYADFLERTFKIFAQFQRAVKFISKFLSSIKVTSTLLPKDTILPSNFITEFSKTVSIASNKQSLSLLDVLVQNVDECFNEISQKDLEYKSPLLFITSDLLINFFKDVKLYAPSIALTTLQALMDKTKITKETLQKFGGFLFSNKSFMLNNENIVKIFLELCFYCGEIEMLINCYKDSLLNPSDVTEPTTECDWHYCLSLEQWKKLVNFVLKSKLKNCDLYCFQLAMQKLRTCKLENKLLMEDSTLKIILNQLTSDYYKFNVFEKITPEDFTILMDKLRMEQFKTVIKSILNQLQQNNNKEEWINWLSNLEIQENSVFISFLFSEILNNTGSYMQDLIVDKHFSKLFWFSDEYFNDCDSFSDEILDSLPEKVNALLKNGRKLKKLITNNDFLLRIVEVFKLLPLFCMKEGFRRLGLSFAVSMATLLAGDENAICSAFESIYNFMTFDLDASICFNIGLFIKFLNEFSYENEKANVTKFKIIETLVRNSPNMKLGLVQLGKMIDSEDCFKRLKPMKALEARILLHNELGKSWQRAKKRKSDNDLIGSFRIKLAKIISEEAKELTEINSENSKIILKILPIEINKAVKLNEEDEIKNLMEQKFPYYFDFTVKNLKKDSDEPSAIFLINFLQLMPQLRKFFPENSVMKIWKALKTQEKVKWNLFCSNTTEEEFNEILADLLKTSEKFFYLNSDKHSTNCFEIWVSFLTFSTGTKKNSCQLKLQEFFKSIHNYDLLLKDLPVKKKIFLIKFFFFCVKNTDVIITSDVLDTIILVIHECFDDSSSIEDFCNLFTAEVEVASSILIKQFAWVRSKIHLIFLMFQRLLKSLMNRFDAGKEINQDDVIKLSNCAYSFEKWVSVIIKQENDFARISAYFIIALISTIASVTVPPAIKIHLTNCINSFLSISDSHTVAYIMRVLKPGYQQVFNTLYTQFQKYHKYTGKV